MSNIVTIALALLASGITVYVFWRAKFVHLTRLQYGVIAAVVTTATVHLLAGPDDLWLYLNGMGFFALLLALYFVPLPRFHGLIAWGLIGYTLLTIALYFVVHSWSVIIADFDVLGLFTKAVEAAAVALLLMEQYRAQTARLINSAKR